MGGVTAKAVKSQFLKLKGPSRGKSSGDGRSVKRGLAKTEEFDGEKNVKSKKMKIEM